jgi:hypothetical protein
MRPTFLDRLIQPEFSHYGPRIIAVGVAILVFSAWSPAVPVVTGMALVALGATVATLARFRNSPNRAAFLLVHVCVYGSLYAMFIGALLHAAARWPDTLLRFLAIADVAMSIWPVALAVELLVAGLRSEQQSS